MNRVRVFLLDGVYALINLNFSKISQNLEDYEIINAHHPKHMHTHTPPENDKENDTPSAPEMDTGETSTEPTQHPTLGKRALRRKRQREIWDTEPTEDHPLYATCKCTCQCVNVASAGLPTAHRQRLALFTENPMTLMITAT
jgi:hypothetical protein